MLIVAANQNQASVLKAEKEFSQAKILSWQEFVTQSWEKQKTPLRLLNAIELNFIWQQCVKQVVMDDFSSVEALAKMAEEAWWLIKNWQISSRLLQQSAHLNTLWFCKVAKIFSAYCEKHQCIDEVSAVAQIHENVSAVYGFLSLTPLQEKIFGDALLCQLEVGRTARNQFDMACQTGYAPSDLRELHYAFDSPEEELSAALNWASEQARQNPSQSIAIIVPELAKYRAYLEGELQLQSTSWRFFLPSTLAEDGFTQIILMLLKQSCSSRIELNTLTSLMRSSHWGIMPQEQFARTAFILKLRELQVSAFDWNTVLTMAEPWPDLQKYLYQLQQARSSKRQDLASWSMHWQALLISLGVQVPEHWNHLLESFAKMMAWHGHFSQSEALQLLQQLARKTHQFFQQKNHTSIVVLGVLDAMYQTFDQVWLTGATQRNIPFQLSINPLIDKTIQKQNGIWALDQTIQDQWQQDAYEKLQAACSKLIVSYAKEDQGRVNTPASFVKEVASSRSWMAGIQAFVGRIKPVCHPWQWVPAIHGRDDVFGGFASLNPPYEILPWQPTQVPGGSGALKSQRLCPMQAFGKYRLDLAALPNTTLGLTPLERGNAVHKALQLIWQQLQTQQALHESTDDGLNALFKKIIPIALQAVPWARRKLLPQALLDLESQYLISILHEWLALEATRPPFKIYALEETSQVLFAGREWRLRVDRIDQLADGRLLLIDYKTGSVSINDWQPDVFIDPQLPLYVVTNALRLDGIAFAEVSDRNMRVVGLANEEMVLGKLGVLKTTEQWWDLKSKWQEILESLVKGFVYSEAKLDPIDADMTCQRCGLQSFCRIFES